jgi:hypothetical protein
LALNSAAKGNFKMKPRVIVLIAIAFAAVLLALFFVPEKNTFTSSALFASDANSAKSKVNVTLHLDRNQVSRGQNLLLTMTVQNDNAAALAGFYASLSAPGFEWDASKFSSQLPTNIASKSTLTRVVPLTALAQSGSYNVVVLYNWNLDAFRSSSLTVGPIRMVGLWGEENWLRFGRRLAQLTKDLTLPIVLAVLGYIFQRLQSRRDRYFQLSQGRRDRAAREQEAIRQEREQVRQNILPLVMTLAEQHYMPIVRGARLLIDDHKKLKEHRPDSSEEKIFFDTLFLLKRMDHLRRSKGQIFFQNGLAERIAADSWFVLREGLLSALGEANVALALKDMAVDDGFAEFQPKILKFKKCLEGFRGYINTNRDEFERYLKLVDLIQAVFRFEANRPFDEHWYGIPRPLIFEFEFDSKPEYPKRNLSEACQNKIKGLPEEWEKYRLTTPQI